MAHGYGLVTVLRRRTPSPFYVTVLRHFPCGLVAGGVCFPLGVAGAPEGAPPAGACCAGAGVGRFCAPAAGAGASSGAERLAASCTRLLRWVPPCVAIMASPSELTKKSAPRTTVALLKKV